MLATLPIYSNPSSTLDRGIDEWMKRLIPTHTHTRDNQHTRRHTPETGGEDQPKLVPEVDGVDPVVDVQDQLHLHHHQSIFRTVAGKETN